MRETVDKYQEHFPQLVSALKGNQYHFDNDLSLLEQLIIACVVCQELSAKLDAGDKSFVDTAASILLEYPPEIQLYSIRRLVNIVRLVTHDLDEHPIFSQILTNVNKIVS
jgi:hypothetical protein